MAKDDNPIYIDGRSCRITPRELSVEAVVLTDEVELRLEDDNNDEFWMHIRIPLVKLEEWQKRAQEVRDNEEAFKRWFAQFESEFKRRTGMTLQDADVNKETVRHGFPKETPEQMVLDYIEKYDLTDITGDFYVYGSAGG